MIPLLKLYQTAWYIVTIGYIYGTLVSTSLEAMVTKADSLFLPNGKHIMLFSDRHATGSSTNNPQQLDTLMNELTTYDNDDNDKLLVLVEAVSNLYYKFTKHKSILSHLPQTIRSALFTKVSSDTIGMPQSILAAVYLLHTKTKEQAITVCNHVPELTSLTFSTIFSLFSDYQKQLIQNLGHIHYETLKAYASKVLTEAIQNKISIRAKFSSHNNTFLCSYIQGKTEQDRKTLSTILIDLFSPLLELNFICHSIKAPQKKIAIFAGYKHIAKIHSLLLDGKAIQSHSIGEIGPSSHGLTKENIALILHQQSPMTYKAYAGYCTATAITLLVILYLVRSAYQSAFL